MKKQKKLCSVKGCGHVAYAGGLCRAHRRRRKLMRNLPLDKAVERACKEPTLLAALTFICDWEEEALWGSVC